MLPAFVICTNLNAGFVVYRNNIALQILLKPEGIEDTLHHRACAVDQVIKAVKLTVGGV